MKNNPTLIIVYLCKAKFSTSLYRNLGRTIYSNTIPNHCILSVSTYETRIPKQWLELETLLPDMW